MQRLLVVDDDPDIRQVLSLLLAADGYQVETAANGAEALERVRTKGYTAVVLDLMMPVMDGWTFLRACRQDPTCGRVPVVVISATPDACQSVAPLGVQDCLSKPFDVHQLLGAVERLA